MKSNFKLIFSSLISIILLISSINTICAASFPDVPDYHTYANEIQYVKEQGFVDGFTDGTYKPEQSITRAEFTKIVINAGYPEDQIFSCLENNGYTDFENSENDPIKQDTFPDLPTENQDNSEGGFVLINPFAPYVCLAKHNNVVSGYSDGTFKPENHITYGEALKIAMRTLDTNHDIDKDAPLTDYLNRMDEKNSRPQTIAQGDVNHIMNRGEIAHITQRIHDDYNALEPEPEPPVSSFMIKPYGTATVAEKGLSISARNFGIHCTTTKNTFIDLDVTKDGQTNRIHLERSCTGISNHVIQGVSTQEADLYGYHFTLTQVKEMEAWDVNSFEYYVEVK
ncbi:hypothetical protein GF362_03355 [Candidatus Dojkabacteria bacterium]|nr:hypothetical protein [Candidatus Dojkabacteria bacterium]